MTFVSLDLAGVCVELICMSTESRDRAHYFCLLGDLSIIPNNESKLQFMQCTKNLHSIAW